MKDYEVGYGKPPREHRFKKGICPNPAGRGKRKSDSIGSVTRDELNEMQEVTVRGRSIRMSRLEVILRGVTRSAARGDVGSAAQLLDLLERAERQEDITPLVVHVSGGLPTELAPP